MNKILILSLIALSVVLTTQKNIEDMTDKELKFLSLFGPSYEKLLEYKRLKLNSKEKTNSNQLISSMSSKYITVASTIDKTKIQDLTKLGIPKYTVDKFKAAIYSKKATATKFTIEIFPTQASGIIGLGSVEFDGNNAKIAYVEAHTTATLIQILEPFFTEHCSGALFWIKFRKNLEKKARGYTIKELELIKQGIKARALNDLNERIKLLESLKTVE